MAQKDELVVPPPIVHAGLVDHLRGMIPGFAAGGVVGSYNGSVSGQGPWVQNEYNATELTIEQAVAAAAAAAIKAAQAAAAAAGAAGPGGGNAAANQALAKSMMPAWAGGSEWAAWLALWNQESGWNQLAKNASSGAYGIPQALPASKMGAAANPPQSNPHAQIDWGASYIKGRYGDPIGAEAHERAFNWYDQGGWLMPGQTLATNNTGKPERVVGPGQEKAMAQAAATRPVVNNNFNYYGPQTPTPEMRQAMMIDLATAVGAAG
jgi:hypothetical protein